MSYFDNWSITLGHTSQPKFEDCTPEFTVQLCFQVQQKLWGLAERRGPLPLGASVNINYSSLMDPGLRFPMEQDALCVDGVWHGKETRLTRKTWAVCNCYFSSLVSWDFGCVWLVIDMSLLLTWHAGVHVQAWAACNQRAPQTSDSCANRFL